MECVFLTSSYKQEEYLYAVFIREFGIRKQVKKLVISQIFCTFMGENQTVTKDISDDYQGQSYGDFLYYRRIRQEFNI